MPLEFDSISHGKIAFGFFNIETDMLLLNQYFLFANDFCYSIARVTEEHKEIYKTTWEVYRIEGPNIGNLMGAIYGIDHRGFIGEIYKLFPFPNRREEFRQKPEGFKNRSVVEKLIQTYANRTNILFVIDQKKEKVSVAEYAFEKTAFQELIKYVWAGGFPRWKDEIRPDYVIAMKEKIGQSKHPFFNGLTLV